MPAQDRSWTTSGDWAPQSFADSPSLPRAWNDSKESMPPHQCRDREGKGRFGDVIEVGKTAIVHLLLPADLVEFDDLHEPRVVEVRHRGVVESEMAILPDPKADHIDRCLV